MNIKTTTLQDKCRGCLIGGAIGDALGYPVEFIFSHKDICAEYGPNGITHFNLTANTPKALISDDTQMTLYTIEGMLEAHQSQQPMLQAITNAYLAWVGPQAAVHVGGYPSELATIDELNQRRAPGNTCITALLSILKGKPANNDSKGCGGIMRVAPIGIYGALKGSSLSQTAQLAGDTALITHKHPLSTYASAALAAIIQQCITPEQHQFVSIVNNAISTVTGLYGSDAPYMGEFVSLIETAIALSNDTRPDWEIIERELGGGWVAEETLAIAIFSVLRHQHNFSACMQCAVNHGGDSDSTGAVAGNILGAIAGYKALPRQLTDNLQLQSLILRYADRLTTL